MSVFIIVVMVKLLGVSGLWNNIYDICIVTVTVVMLLRASGPCRTIFDE
jgi:hypothetical protein